MAAARSRRIPGDLYKRLEQLERRLERWGILLERNADDELDTIGEARGVYIAALFHGKMDGTGILRIRRNPTQYEILHELGHILDFRRNPVFWVRPASNEALALVIREQAVYNRLRNSRSWYRLSFEERLHAYRYIENLGGNPRVDLERNRTMNKHDFR